MDLLYRFRPAYVAAGLSAFAIIEARINGYRSKYVLPFIILCVVINVLKSVKSDGAAFLME